MDKLTSIIATLIASGKEGDYWDFKQTHHAQNQKAALVHDIICLANNIRHKGDRYLIFGISNDSEIIGLHGFKRTQAQFIDLLRAVKFASGVHPDVQLETISLEGKEIDVLIIKDNPNKPYYLEKAYKDADDSPQGKSITISAGTIYTRTYDTNTPRDTVASVQDIERMWRQRFGLDTTPYERLKNYLLHYADWEETGEQSWHHKQFPEFTIKPLKGPKEASEHPSWERAATSPSSFVMPLGFFYHQTLLKAVNCVLYDEMREFAPSPEMVWPKYSKLRFYAYYADSFEFLFLQFLRKASAAQLLFENAPLKDRTGIALPVLIFKNPNEKEYFLDYLAATPELEESTESRHFSDFAIRNREEAQDLLTFCYKIYIIFNEWRAAHRGH